MPVGLLLFADCSTSTTCNPATDVFVDLPAGTDGISSLEATGACAPLSPPVGGCVPVTTNCETARCECKVEIQVNQTTFGSGSTPLCHIQVTSKTGAVFTRDLTFTSAAGSCFSVSGPTGDIQVDFADAGIGDAGAADAGTADVGAADAAEAANADAADAGAADGDAAG